MNLNVVMYGVIFIATAFFWKLENTDVRCPSFTSTEEECDKGGGMSFSHTRPEPGDSCVTLLRKLYKAAGAEQASVKWRRSFILSVVVMTVMWLLVGTPGSFPDWKIFYLSVLIGYAVLLGSYMYYSYHVFGVAETWMKETIDILRTKCIKE
jgi:hypothetical protein